MAVTLINASGYQWGVESAETGVNVESFSCAYRPEIDEPLQNISGEQIGSAIGETETEISVEGEINNSTGLMAAAFTTTTTIANDDDQFGASTGGIYLKEATVSQSRTGWRRVSLRFMRRKGHA